MSADPSKTSIPKKIRRIEAVDENILNALIANHLEIFGGTVSACLGKRYLKYFFKKIIIDPGSIMFGYFGDNGELQGSVGGTLASDLFFDKRHKARIAVSLCQKAFAFKLSFPKILRLMRKQTRFGKCAVNTELLSLMVRPEARKQGIGRSLVAALCRYFDEKGKEEWKVSTDIKLGHDFYLNLKMEKWSEFELRGVTTSLFGGKTKDYL